VTGPERGYRSLLRAYPAWYRRERGDEMLDTLLATTPDGRTWPAPRDAAALILGGLRVRAGLDRRLPAAASLRLAALLGVALWLAGQASGSLSLASLAGLHRLSPAFGDARLVAFSGLLVLAATGAAWFAPRPITAAVSLAAAAVCAYQSWTGSGWSLLGAPALLAALALLALGRERMPRSWLWLLGIEFAVRPVQWLAAMGRHPVLFFLSPVANDLPWVIVSAVVLWAVVDVRPAIAVGLCTMLDRVIPFATNWYDTNFGSNLSWFLPLAIGAVLVLVMAPRLRRQAVL
jgi:hypothetical protein